jgi:hypothetical protein
MKFVRREERYNLLDHRKYEDILEEFKTRPTRKEVSTV